MISASKASYLITFFLIVVAVPFAGCFSPQVDPNPTHTPNPCLGWDCQLTGSVYIDNTSAENALAGIPVVLRQISWCSPTAGEYETITAEDGSFSFDVFLHDTDSFVLTIATPGFPTFQQKMGGFDCLYCHCEPFEVVLD